VLPEAFTFIRYQNHTHVKKVQRGIIITGIVIAVLWTALTIWAESKGPARTWQLGDAGAEKKALIVYDADPFYNLDEQVCRSFAAGLAESGMHATVATVAAADSLKSRSFDLYVFCANTYNWRPDWAVTNFIKEVPIKGQPVVAITLGAGSTTASRKAFEKKITAAGGRLVGSRENWLWRPNDENRTDMPNVPVAVALAHDWARAIAPIFDTLRNSTRRQ
jgi:hypothetical protein